VRPEQEQRVERRLAAIFAADVAGYSRPMSHDEAVTLRALTAAREIMDSLIAERRQDRQRGWRQRPGFKPQVNNKSRANRRAIELPAIIIARFPLRDARRAASRGAHNAETV
jgi:hypothetical protein